MIKNTFFVLLCCAGMINASTKKVSAPSAHVHHKVLAEAISNLIGNTEDQVSALFNEGLDLTGSPIEGFKPDAKKITAIKDSFKSEYIKLKYPGTSIDSKKQAAESEKVWKDRIMKHFQPAWDN